MSGEGPTVFEHSPLITHHSPLTGSDKTASLPSLRTSLAWSAAGAGGVQLLQFVVGVLLARLLAPQAFGLLGMAMVVTGLAALVVEAGLGTVLIQRPVLTPALLTTVFWTGLMVGAAQCGALWLAAPSLARVLDQPALTAVLRGCGLVLLLGPAGLVHRSLLTRELNFRALARVEGLAVAVGSGVAVVLALTGAGVGALAARLVMTGAVGTVLAWARHPWRPPGRATLRDEWSYTELRRLLPFGGSVVGTEILNQVAQNLDFLLIGRFLGAGLLGEYALAYNLATLPQGRLAPALVRVMLPLFARVQADDAVIRRSYLRLVRGMALISFPFLTGLALLGPALLPAVYGPKWRGALAPLPALCIAGAAYAMSTTVGALYRSKGRGDRELAITAARALLLAGCIITALSGWGTAKAVSVAVAGYAVISTFAFQPVANRLIDLRMRDYLAALLPGAIAAGVVAAALEMPPSGLFGAASVTLVGVTLWRDGLGRAVFGPGCSVFGPAGSKPSSPLSDRTPRTEHRTPTAEETADAA